MGKGTPLITDVWVRGEFSKLGRDIRGVRGKQDELAKRMERMLSVIENYGKNIDEIIKRIT